MGPIGGISFRVISRVVERSQFFNILIDKISPIIGLTFSKTFLETV